MLQGLLGDYKWFRTHYEAPITAGTDRQASDSHRRQGAARAADLRARIAPSFLRREKSQILQQAGR